MAALWLVSACEPGRHLTFADAVEVPLDPKASGQLARVLEQAAKQEGFFFRDSSAYMRATTEGQFTVHMTMFRPLEGEKEWPEVQIQAEGDHSPWVLFLPPAEERYAAATARTRQRILAALRERWPNLRKIPILPSGGVPLADDVVLTSRGYKVVANRASDYELGANSPLVAR